MYNIRLLITCGSFLLLVSTCKGRYKQASTVKSPHGLLEDRGNHNLISIPPGSSLTVCGTKSTEVLTGIRTWAAVIGRDKLINFSDTCDQHADHTVNVYTFEDNGIGKKGCDDYQNQFSYTLSKKREIYLCPTWKKKSEEGVILHETGHLWGLCDQYPPRDGHKDNCDPKFKTPNQNPTGIMATSSAQGLQEDDKRGIVSAALLLDIPANALWRKQVTIDYPFLRELNSDKCQPCGLQLADERFCGEFSEDFNRFLSGSWIACRNDADFKDLCNKCSGQLENKRFCGIIDKNKGEFTSGEWISCSGTKP
jgi:hypothetical protein